MSQLRPAVHSDDDVDDKQPQATNININDNNYYNSPRSRVGDDDDDNDVFFASFAGVSSSTASLLSSATRSTTTTTAAATTTTTANRSRQTEFAAALASRANRPKNAIDVLLGEEEEPPLT